MASLARSFAHAALGGFFLGAIALVACSGSSTPPIPSTEVGDGTSGTPQPPSGTSGVVCQPCATPPPAPGCTGTPPCGCGPYVCPDAGPDGSRGDTPCVWSQDGNSCGAGMYCFAPGCASGVCRPIAKEQPSITAPVCGCNGVTFLNAELAANRGMSVRGDGECKGVQAATCGGFGGIQCPLDATCSYLAQNELECNIVDASGTCWVLPPVCPLTGNLKPYRKCAAEDDCADQCALIRQGARYYRATGTCF